MRIEGESETPWDDNRARKRRERSSSALLVAFEANKRSYYNRENQLTQPANQHAAGD
jgi:hypothetical protein